MNLNNFINLDLCRSGILVEIDEIALRFVEGVLKFVVFCMHFVRVISRTILLEIGLRYITKCM